MIVKVIGDVGLDKVFSASYIAISFSRAHIRLWLKICPHCVRQVDQSTRGYPCSITDEGGMTGFRVVAFRLLDWILD